MTSSSAALSIFRSSSGRHMLSRIASKPKASNVPPPLRASPTSPLSQRVIRRPAQLSFAVESMMPYHNATASALMTSMLSISRCSCGWLPEGRVKTR
ncbi:hypothetical protein K2173_018650 [Erythroxylum novogranatense]|uniref:Protein NUCLEAR FUSION DEFECTIVE 6, chloroplastic/mitochondrial-like n=1 Tax=Erythroxylum novogranatense TaxID=1862640 RepID=A0AAV8SAT5_9ROSI|nr:hypothetical protein K2173_018650 [Erythroxylum novogranatense]